MAYDAKTLIRVQMPLQVLHVGGTTCPVQGTRPCGLRNDSAELPRFCCLSICPAGQD
jgi:hypothetical protein